MQLVGRGRQITTNVGTQGRRRELLVEEGHQELGKGEESEKQNKERGRGELLVVHETGDWIVAMQAQRFALRVIAKLRDDPPERAPKRSHWPHFHSCEVPSSQVTLRSWP